jgi:hypothetical protein
MRLTTAFLAFAPLLALAQPNKLHARQDAPIDVPEGPLPLCTNYCFGMWGWPIVSLLSIARGTRPADVRADAMYWPRRTESPHSVLQRELRGKYSSIPYACQD